MKRYESSEPVVRQPAPESPLAVRAIGSAAGLAAGVLLLCMAFGVPFAWGWRIAAVIGALCILVAGAGSFRRVIEYALNIGERVTQIDFNNDGLIGQDIRIIPVRGGNTMHVSGSNGRIDEDDLRYMVQRLDIEQQTGWTQREWLTETLPSGRQIVSVDLGPYAEFIKLLEQTGALIDRDERRKGQLVKSPEMILAELGL